MLSEVDFKHALHDRISPLHDPQVKRPSNLAKSRVLTKSFAPLSFAAIPYASCFLPISFQPCLPREMRSIFHWGAFSCLFHRYFYLICPSVFSAQSLVLTFPNSFNTLSTAEIISCARSELLFYALFDALPVLRLKSHYDGTVLKSCHKQDAPETKCSLCLSHRNLS